MKHHPKNTLIEFEQPKQRLHTLMLELFQTYPLVASTPQLRTVDPTVLERIRQNQRDQEVLRFNCLGKDQTKPA
jgi:hypothetical protein